MWTFANGWRVFPFSSTWTRAQTSTLTSPKRQRVRVAKGREASLIDYWLVRWPNYVHKLWNCSLILAVRAKRQFFFFTSMRKNASHLYGCDSLVHTHTRRALVGLVFSFFSFFHNPPAFSLDECISLATGIFHLDSSQFLFHRTNDWKSLFFRGMLHSSGWVSEREKSRSIVEERNETEKCENAFIYNTGRGKVPSLYFTFHTLRRSLFSIISVYSLVLDIESTFLLSSKNDYS